MLESSGNLNNAAKLTDLEKMPGRIPDIVLDPSVNPVMLGSIEIVRKFRRKYKYIKFKFIGRYVSEFAVV